MKERIITKAKRLMRIIVPVAILAVIAYLIYKSLHHCYETICTCGVEEGKIWDYLFVQGTLLVIYVAMRIVACLREKAIRFTQEIRFFSYAFSLMPLAVRLWMNFSEKLVQQIMIEILPVLAIELLLIILLEIYDELPPATGKGGETKPRPKRTPTQ